MNIKLFFASFSLFLFVLFVGVTPNVAQAGECFSQPITPVEGSATVTSGVNVRDGGCTTGTSVLGTLSSGTVVNLHAIDDGWYEVSTFDGLRGWVWQDFLSLYVGVVAEEPEKTHEEKEDKTYDEKPDASLVDRMKGRILLQVEELGEAYYVHPETGYRYYMKDGDTAYEMMRAFGLGITNNDLSNIPLVGSEDEMLETSSVCSSNSLAAGVSGKILLQVEELGEAYYVHPDTCKRIYMQNGATAYQIMRKLSLGITNKDLGGVTLKEFEAVPYEEKETVADKVVVGESPEGIDLDALNVYWLNLVNDLREDAGVRLLELDDRWKVTATDYAEQMYENQWFAHERDGGLSMHQWIDEQGLDFTERYSAGGWETNYFTENIAWGYASGSQESVEEVLENTMDFFESEASWNGPHYRTTYHPDWNSVGVGFYFDKLSSGKYKVYVVMHYGSLE